MEKKLLCMLVCTLLILTMIPLTNAIVIDADKSRVVSPTETALLGFGDDPEIIDDETEDFDLFGPFVSYPTMFSLFTMLGMFEVSDFEVIDIVSAWFYENPDEPDYLYTAIQVKGLEYIGQRAIFAVHWSYSGKKWGVGIHAHSNGEYVSCFAGEDRTRNLYEAEGSLDLANDVITFKLRKDIVGDPQPGGVLTKTWAWNALRFTFQPFTWLFGGELTKDYAPGLTEEGAADYGRDYVIQY